MTPDDIARRSIKLGAIQKQSELRMLIATVKRLKPMTVVEIGSYHAGTFYAWCQVSDPDATLVGINLPENTDGFYGIEAEKLRDRMHKHAGPTQFTALFPSDSHDPETLRQLEDLLDGDQVDFLFIDGDHSYAGVKRDFEMYAPLVRDGGAIAFHDVLPHNRYAHCHVDKYWREIKRQYTDTKNFLDHSEPDWGGIGVIYQGSKRGAVAETSAH